MDNSEIVFKSAIFRIGGVLEARWSDNRDVLSCTCTRLAQNLPTNIICNIRMSSQMYHCIRPIRPNSSNRATQPKHCRSNYQFVLSLLINARRFTSVHRPSRSAGCGDAVRCGLGGDGFEAVLHIRWIRSVVGLNPDASCVVWRVWHFEEFTKKNNSMSDPW